MRLKLRSFRQYREKSFSFPGVGLVRLKGKSGSGKTTVMMAFRFAITGEGKKLKPLIVGGSPRVDLEMPELNMTIIRTSTPDTLQVFHEGVEYRDAAAQAEINKVFGFGTDEEFRCASYVSQRIEGGALIKMGAADMLRMIQRLAFREQDPEVIKKKITTKLTQLDKEYAIAIAAKNSTEAQIKTLEAKLAAAAIPEPPAPFTPDETTHIQSEYERLALSLNDLNKRLRDLMNEMNDPVYEGIQSVQIGLSLSEKGLAELTERRSKLLLQLSFGKDSRPTVDGEDMEPVFAAKLRYLETMEQIKEMVAKAKQVWPDLSGPLGKFLEGKIEQNQRDAKTAMEISRTAHSAYADAKLQVKPYTCPACAAGLKFVNGELHQHDGVFDPNALDKAASQVTQADAAVVRISDERVMLNRWLSNANNLKSALGTDPAPELKSLEEIRSKRAAIASQVKARNDWDANYAALEKQVEDANREVARLEAQIEKHKKFLSDHSDWTPKSQLKSEYDTLDALYKSEKIQSEMIRQKIIQLDAYAALMQKVDKAKAVQAELLSQIDEVKLTLKLQADAADKLNESIGGWSRLKERSDFAALQAVEKKISEINNNSQAYLNDFFPDDGTTAQILNVTKTQKGEERAKLSLDITHKGAAVGGDTELLSGGELDRIVMSFQLAMSDMYNSPIMMVDEGFTGADVEKTLTDCIQVLKTFSASKLVLVIQHGAADELFDEVIDLGSDID